ncbi:MAG: sporulation protein YabP [Lachnospiraceae bacterium]|nr:sporulation protein YabP [Lachnospiraceae bacterium]
MELKNDRHTSVMNDRKHVELQGVKNVISFDTEEVLLDTTLGGLLIKGAQLNINQLDLEKGLVEIDGKINAMIYSDKSPSDSSAKNLISRLFR